MKQEFATYEEMQAFVDTLLTEEKWVIDIRQQVKDGPFSLEWMEHKKYTTFDGVEYFDELWRTEDGTLHLIQDLSPEHARNCLRMIMRKEREYQESMDLIRKNLADAIEGGGFADIFGDTLEEDEPFNPNVVAGNTTLQ